MTKQPEGKIAMVTGGAAGFGEGIVRLFVEHGAHVVLADLDAAKGSALAAALYLASDAAACISGVEFPVDGGRTV